MAPGVGDEGTSYSIDTRPAKNLRVDYFRLPCGFGTLWWVGALGRGGPPM
jgi:hypothetical protein